MSIDKNVSRVMLPTGEGDVFGKLAAQYVAETSNSAFTRQLFGVSIDIEGISQGPEDPTVEEAVAIAALQSLLAHAYLAGRADQIADVYGSNAKRTVRARDLKEVIDTANTFNAAEPIDSKEVLAEFADMRSPFKNVQLYITSPSESGTSTIFDALAENNAQITVSTEFDEESFIFSRVPKEDDSSKATAPTLKVEAMK